jgi:hypothetical protein
MAEITGDYAEHTKEDLVAEITRRNDANPDGERILSSGTKEELITRLFNADTGGTQDTGADATPDESDSDKDGTPTAGTGGGASVQPAAENEDDGSDDDDAPVSDKAGDPAVAEVTQLQLLEQHGTSTEGVEQAEEIQASLDERQEEAKSNVSEISDEDAKALYEANTGVPKWRKNTEDLTDEEKESPSDYPTPTGDGAQAYSEEHQDAADREREAKNATLPKFDTREQFDDEVPPNEKLLDRIGESGRGDTIRSDDDEVPEYLGGTQHKYVAPDDTTWREIATELGLSRPDEIAFLNGRFDGTAHVAKGTEVLLPTGYDYQ